MYKLITVRDYAKAHDISEQATRKRISSKLLTSCQLDNLTYVAIEDPAPLQIKELKGKIKLLQANVRTMKAATATAHKQDEEILYLRETNKTLLSDLRASAGHINTAADRLNKATETKDELHSLVFTTLNIELKGTKNTSVEDAETL